MQPLYSRPVGKGPLPHGCRVPLLILCTRVVVLTHSVHEAHWYSTVQSLYIHVHVCSTYVRIKKIIINFLGYWGSASDSGGGAYSAPLHPLAVARGGSTIHLAPPPPPPPLPQFSTLVTQFMPGHKISLRQV